MVNRVDMDSLHETYELRNFWIQGDNLVVSWPLNYDTYEGRKPDGQALYTRKPDGELVHIQDFWPNGKERNL